MIKIIDYGLGNVNAIVNVYERLNILATKAKCSDDFSDCTKIILPGVGSFDHAMYLLQNSGMLDTINHLVLNEEIPILGICVGMQLFANKSEEGIMPGLGWISGNVCLFESKSIQYETKYPHMGWNNVLPCSNNPLFYGIQEYPKFYFLHSYYFDAFEKTEVIAETEYGIRYPSVINKKNIYGVQFHPEKSHKNGISLLENFAKI